MEKLSIARSEECAEDTEFILERKAEARYNKGTTLTWRPPRAAVPLPSYCRLQGTTGWPCTQSHQSLTLAMLPTGTLLVSRVNRDKPEAKLEPSHPCHGQLQPQGDCSVSKDLKKGRVPLIWELLRAEMSTGCAVRAALGHPPLPRGCPGSRGAGGHCTHCRVHGQHCPGQMSPQGTQLHCTQRSTAEMLFLSGFLAFRLRNCGMLWKSAKVLIRQRISKWGKMGRQAGTRDKMANL